MIDFYWTVDTNLRLLYTPSPLRVIPCIVHNVYPFPSDLVFSFFRDQQPSLLPPSSTPSSTPSNTSPSNTPSTCPSTTSGTSPASGKKILYLILQQFTTDPIAGKWIPTEEICDLSKWPAIASTSRITKTSMLIRYMETAIMLINHGSMWFTYTL